MMWIGLPYRLHVAPSLGCSPEKLARGEAVEDLHDPVGRGERIAEVPLDADDIRPRLRIDQQLDHLREMFLLG
ncbi:MAG: hypothetical protein ACHRHE_16235, partial [Tepidisphaerales bacterium]